MAEISEAPTLTPQCAASLPIELQTGYLDDIRRLLTRESDPKLYRLFADARDTQDEWSDGEHRDFWGAFLAYWPAKRGNRSTVQSQIFMLAAALSDGFKLEEVASELPYRGLKDLRNRVLPEAAKWVDALNRPPQPPGTPGPELAADETPKSRARALTDARRRWRLPRVFIRDFEERTLPPAAGIFGWINLPVVLPKDSLAPVGDQSLWAFNEFCGALRRLRQRRGWPDLRAQVARCTRVESCEEPIQHQRGSEPPVGEIGCDPFEWETRRRRVADLVEAASAAG